MGSQLDVPNTVQAGRLSWTSNRHINSPFEHPYMYRLTLCPVAAALEDHAVATGHLKAGLKTHVFKTRDFKEENAVGF